MKTTAIIMATAVLAAANVFAAATPASPATPTTTAQGVQSPSTFPMLGSPKSQGCFSSSGDLKLLSPPLQYMSMGSCTDACKLINASVSALHAADCFCGNEYPPKNDVADDFHCNFPCPVYPQEACGGISGGNNTQDYYGIFNNGLVLEVPFLGPSPSSTSDPSHPATSTAAQSTVVVTQTSKPSGGGSSSSSTGGIAAGVIIGVLAVAGIVGGVFWFLRRKRNREIEEEHRRNAAVNAFIHGSKAPSTAGLSMSDQRMDPIMANRRLSDGSIADNQDYSRKILRVTNA